MDRTAEDHHVMWSTLLLCAPAPAPQTFPAGATVELPALGGGDADHATVAINAAGDVLAAWSTARPELGQGAFQVEACFLPYRGRGRWAVPASAKLLLLGDPLAGVFSGGPESCRKPDVQAAGNDFFVVWPRSDATRQSCRLELVRLRVQAGVPLLEAPAPGVGYVVDAELDGASSGTMPDLVESATLAQGVAVVYADDELQAPPWREFDLRVAAADFATLPPALHGPYLLADDLPFDDGRNGGEPAGGKVLPDVVLDDAGRLVVAWEQYVHSGHAGAPEDRGTIQVRWFSDPALETPAELARQEFGGLVASDYARRPNLASSRRDPTDEVALAYLLAADGSSTSDVAYLALQRDGASASAQDLGYPCTAGDREALPFPVHGASVQACLAIRQSGAMAQLEAYAQRLGLGALPATAGPWRPAADLLEPPPPDFAADALIPVTYEAPAGPHGVLRIHLTVYAAD